MARNDNAKKKWSIWFTGKINELGMTSSDLVQVSDGALTYSTVSSWTVGRSGVSAENALIVAAIFGVAASEALEAAGYQVLADAMAGRELRLVGTPAPSADPDILRLVAKAEAEGLPESTVKILIEWWDRHTAEDKARRLATAEQMLAMRREADTA